MSARSRGIDGEVGREGEDGGTERDREGGRKVEVGR